MGHAAQPGRRESGPRCRCTHTDPRAQIAEKVKLFFFEYARNRHKMTTLTPSYHAVRPPAAVSRYLSSPSVPRRSRIAPTTTVSRAQLASAHALTPAAGFDLRSFLYPSRFPFQFRQIDQLAAKVSGRRCSSSCPR